MELHSEAQLPVNQVIYSCLILLHAVCTAACCACLHDLHDSNLLSLHNSNSTILLCTAVAVNLIE